MMIEVKLYNFLKARLDDVTVCLERPETKPEYYVLIERTGGTETNYISSATVDIISKAPTLYKAMELDEKVRNIMRDFVSVDNVSSCIPNATGNWTDTVTHEYRYHSTFIIRFMED
ncbi:hypothetical protein ACTQZS_14840 [Bilifractor sp. LCP19S3_H10]|uniref:hypothetical protein n=1 Tax=Bilifractor sp. LCP19S3_H10 TaxID=3438736 RepID=UPI003F8EDEDF